MGSNPTAATNIFSKRFSFIFFNFYKKTILKPVLQGRMLTHQKLRNWLHTYCLVRNLSNCINVNLLKRSKLCLGGGDSTLHQSKYIIMRIARAVVLQLTLHTHISVANKYFGKHLTSHQEAPSVWPNFVPIRLHILLSYSKNDLMTQRFFLPNEDFFYQLYEFKKNICKICTKFQNLVHQLNWASLIIFGALFIIATLAFIHLTMERQQQGSRSL